ncbi:lipopolysaccharide biosynthesis protein [Egicoccus halophilus]|uniref:lipopolysaccharide biosynthesis protein n=1 Tax=Egicoccus halophilus TaxID=1670830 RepID=UPI00227B28CC|nr:lipopolysaccharide biosynthesis protein [Egicoccus halophilus]
MRGAAWSALEKWGARLLSTAVFIVLARLLDPAAFGLVALSAAIVDVTERLREQGLTLAVVQRKDLTDRQVHSAFWFSIVFGVLLGGIVAALAGPFAILFGEPGIRDVLPWLALGMVLAAFGRIPTALVMRRFEFRALALRGILANTVAGAVAIGLAFLGAGVWALVVQNLLQALVTTVVVLTIARYRPRASFDRTEFRPLWQVGNRVLGFDLLTLAHKRGDDLVLGALIGSVALGYYTIAYRLLAVMSEALSKTVQQVAVPTFSRLQDEPVRLARAFSQATTMTLTAAMPAAVGLALVAPEIVPLVFGAQWLPAVPAMQWLCVVVAVQNFDYFVYDVLLASGRAGLRLWLQLARAVTSLTFFVTAALATQDFVAVAASQAAVTTLFVPVSLAVMRRTVRLDVGAFARQVAPVVLATGIMVGGVLLVRATMAGATDLAVLVACVLAGAATYSLGLLLVGREQIREVLTAGRSLRP